jgi:hypothetical protein
MNALAYRPSYGCFQIKSLSEFYSIWRAAYCGNAGMGQEPGHHHLLHAPPWSHEKVIHLDYSPADGAVGDDDDLWV